MERNTTTTISHLQIGDRFYKISDRNKSVWTKVEGKVVITKYQTYKHWAIKDGERHADMFKSDTAVIFLRSQ